MAQDPSSQDPNAPSPEFSPESSETESNTDFPPTDAVSETTGEAPAARAKPGTIRRGLLDVLLILILAGLVGADYLLYRMQQDQTALLSARLEEMNTRLNALEAAQGEKDRSAQAVAGLRNELQSLRGQVSDALGRQQESLDRLRSEMQDAAPAPSAPTRGLTRHAPPQTEPEEEEEPSHDSTEPALPPAEKKTGEEEYVDFVESAGSKIWHWIKEGAGQLWDTVKGWVGPGSP